MKRIFFLFGTFLIFMSFPLFSQDIIIKNDKAEIRAKVVEIQENLIKYNLFEDPNGPLRNIQISDVFMIIYENGKRETFLTGPEIEHNTNSVRSSSSTNKSELPTSNINNPTTKGNIVLGGDIYFGQYDYESKQVDPIIGSLYESSSTSYSISPIFGYFILKGLVFGLSPSFSYTTEKTKPGDYLGKTYEIGLTPFIKYYFKNQIFIGLESGFSYSNIKSNSVGFPNYKKTTKGFTISPSLGYAFFINPKVSFEPSINYTYSKQSSILTGSTYEGIRKNFAFSAGFHFFL